MAQEKMDVDPTANMEWSPSNDPRPPDVTFFLNPPSWKFHAHKDVLRKCSDYFSTVFPPQMIQGTRDRADLLGIRPDLFQIIIEGIYTGQLALTEDNVFNVVQAAERLKINDPLKSIYLAFMRDKLINLECCFKLMYFCVFLNLKTLYCDARRFCLANLNRLKQSPAIINLTLSQLYDYLSDKFLIVEEELHVVQALHHWLCENKNFSLYSLETFHFKDKLKKLISECISYKRDDKEACDIITKAVLKDRLPIEHIQLRLYRRKQRKDIYMFWALLASLSDVDGPVEVFRLNADTGDAHSIGKMTDITDRPRLHLGSATCYFAHYVYISGGGPEYGKVNWIRNIWMFDVSRPWAGWEAVAELIDFRRCHAMLILNNKLYVFGGFGKFRVKNPKLHRLDLVTGIWEQQLAPMPVHESNPAAVTADNCIYYISSNWTIYSFSTEVDQWSILNVNYSTLMFPLDTKPVAFFSIKVGDINLLAVLYFTRCTLNIILYERHRTSSLYRYTGTASCHRFLTYEGSLLVNEKLIIFYTTDDPFYSEKEVEQYLAMTLFDPVSLQFIWLRGVQNVRRAESFVEVPYFPDEFQVACKELL